MTVGELLAHPLVSADILHAPGEALETELDWVVHAERLEAVGEAEAESVVLAPASAILAPASRSELARLAALGVRLFLGRSEAGPAGMSAPDQPFTRRLGAVMALLPPGRGYREVSWVLRGEARDTVERRSGDGLGVADSSAAALPASPAALLAAIGLAAGSSLAARFAPEAVYRLPDGNELLQAVEAYLRHGRNAVAAAAELGVHRHTVHARIARYESIIGLSLDDPQARTLASLAFSLGP